MSDPYSPICTFGGVPLTGGGSFPNNIAAYVSFVNGRDYVLRMILDGWELDLPSAAQIPNLALRVAAMPAVCNELAGYRVKSVVFNHIPQGTAVGYYEPSLSSVSVDMCPNTLTAGDGTWAIDLVFTAGDDEKSITSVQKWKSYLASALAGTRGTPTVYAGALVDLYQGAPAGDGQDAYTFAQDYWQGMQPYWQITKKPSSLSPTGYGFDWAKINNLAPFVAWNFFPPHIGQNGLGIATGDAFDPAGLAPVAVSATSMPAPTTVGQPDRSVTPADPSAYPTTLSWADLGWTQRVGTMAAGAGLAWMFARFVLNWGAVFATPNRRRRRRSHWR